MIDNSPLFTAIDSAPEKVLRALCKSMCKDVPEARMQAEKQLLVEKITTLSDNDDESGSEKPSISKANNSNMKSVVPRYAFCQNCEKDFETDKNSSTACRYHPEEMYVDVYEEDFEIDSEEMREDHPEHFEFLCCGDTLKDNPHGCKVGSHVDASAQNNKTAKRARLC
ncbi:hypothetical protein N7540_008132 [Penicillium herquei]|nr:hypothetical protein N7540_008132 [Penicillium herquei]